MIVGGTGMLSGVCRALARRGHRVSVLARRPADLGPGVVCYPCDYTDSDVLELAVRSALEDAGAPRLLLTWIHSTAPLAAARIRSWTTPERHLCVLGSASAQTPAPDPSEAGCQQVVLGFVIESGTSRWLTHDEICAGVLGAIDVPRPRTVVGVVEPWSKRPG